MARRLHEALESYDLPDGVLVNGRESFSPIFRDVTELTAAHSLSEKIRQALEQSSFLIVLCSPASKDSHWVNEEIRLFRELHGDRAILSAIVEGTPTTSFPPALLEKGHEPLAANLKQGRDSFRFGVHQLAASILGVGLDTLVQRGERKRRLKTQLIMAGMTALAVIMSGFAFTTFKAQKAAEKSRDDAERLVEYMVSDLKSELYALQRLDILDGLGEEIVKYYDGIDPERLPNERLVKLITAMQTLAEVSNLEQNWGKSHQILDDASKLIVVLEQRNPKSDESLFYRAQNEYWIGNTFYLRRDYVKALPHYEIYDFLSNELYLKDSSNRKWMMEAGWGQGNLGLVHRRMKNYKIARGHYVRGAKIFAKIYELDANNFFVAYEYANLLSGLANAEENTGDIRKGLEIRRQTLAIYEDAIKNSPNRNFKAEFYYNQSLRQLRIRQGYSPCKSAEFAQIHQQSLEIHRYEPQNRNWKEEHLDQELARLEDCRQNHPNEEIDSDIEKLFDLLNEPGNEDLAKSFQSRIKKLRVRDPEPMVRD